MRAAQRGRLAATAALALIPLAAMPAYALTSSGDGPVSTDTPYVKANGATPSTGDAINFCGQNKRQQNEPTSAVDYRTPSIVTSGSNDYCTVQGAGGTWTGFYRSTDSGATWTDSLLPGYPTDTSAEGQASPLHQLGLTNAGDPVQAWDKSGRDYYMGDAFNRAKPQLGSIWVATYDQDAAHYVRTVLVARGTPAVTGKFNDKTSIEVDRSSNSATSGNVYVAWSVFQGKGNNEIMFARSTDHGAHFSQPMKISVGSKDNQFPDITVDSAGTVYVAWAGTTGSHSQAQDAMLITKSTNGGTSFSTPRVAARFDGFDAADTYGNAAAADAAHEKAYLNADGPESDGGPTSAGDARDCGSGPNSCVSGFTFFRHDSQPRITADPSGTAGQVWMVFDATVPSTEKPSTSTYNTAPVAADGTLMVGQGAIYLTSTGNGGSSWSSPKQLDPQAVGHQWFPDINADGGKIFAVWNDSRNDSGYSVQNPPGDSSAVDPTSHRHIASSGVDTYGASSSNGGSTWTFSRLTSTSSQPNYEMFGDRTVPFQGDYNYVSSVGGFAYGTWTDNREVVAGSDPRYPDATGFDVLQCRSSDPSVADSCPNNGGLDQDIYGAAMTP